MFTLKVQQGQRCCRESWDISQRSGSFSLMISVNSWEEPRLHLWTHPPDRGGGGLTAVLMGMQLVNVWPSCMFTNISSVPVGHMCGRHCGWDHQEAGRDVCHYGLCWWKHRGGGVWPHGGIFRLDSSACPSHATLCLPNAGTANLSTTHEVGDSWEYTPTTMAKRLPNAWGMHLKWEAATTVPIFEV